MFDPFSIDYPYSNLQFINNLPAYDASLGTIEMLDLIREIQTSGNYYFQGMPFPVAGATTVPAFGTVNGTFQVPAGTYVTSISHYAGNAEGFKVKLYDKGSKASIFYGDYAKTPIVSSDMVPTTEGPFGPAYLMSPFIINDPGVLGWEVVNLSSTDQVLQVLLCVAVPINKRSIGANTVSRGY